jgi:hypothetical protein
MPKFMTYQRPAPVNKQSWGGKPGHPVGPANKQKLPRLNLPTQVKLPSGH